MYGYLVNLLNNQRSEENINTNMAGMLVNSFVIRNDFFGWILDSGATDYMLFDLNLMHDIKDIFKKG